MTTDISGADAARAQQAVAAARADVLGGRGIGATATEQARHQTERAMLGALPAPLERELVHLASMMIRGRADEASVEDIRVALDRVRGIWDPQAAPTYALMISRWTDELTAVQRMSPAKTTWTFTANGEKPSRTP